MLLGSAGSDAYATGSLGGTTPARPAASGPTWSSLATDGDVAAARISWSGSGADETQASTYIAPVLAVESPSIAPPGGDETASPRPKRAAFNTASAPSPATLLAGGLLVAAWLWRQLVRGPSARAKPGRPSP